MGRLKDLLLFRIKYEGKESYLIAFYYFLISLAFMYGSYWLFDKALGLTYTFLFTSVLMLSLCFAYVWNIVRRNMQGIEVAADVVFGLVYVILFLLIVSLAQINIKPSITEVLITIFLFYASIALGDDFVRFFKKFTFPQILALPIPPITSTFALPAIFTNPFYLLIALIVGYFIIKLLKYIIRIAIVVTFLWMVAKALGVI